MFRFAYAPAARLLAAALLLTAAASCKKDEPAPSNTALLTAPTWRTVDARLTINGVEGVYTPAAADVVDTRFTADGKYTSTPASGTASTGTWAFASNETQLVQTSGSSSPSTDPYQIFTLTSTDLVIGYNTYTQAQVQHALNNNNTTPTATDRTILTLILGVGSFKFPNNTPPVSNAPQITSLSFRGNYKAR